MLIDIHAHIWGTNIEKDKAEIIKACEYYDIAKVYISGLKGFNPDEDEIRTLNSAVYQFMREYPKYIGGFCYINPLHSNCIDELKKGIEEYGMAGMKLWVATYCDDPSVFPLIEKCIDMKVPILVHAFHKAVGQLENESTGPNVARLAKLYPEAKILMAHLGANVYHGIKAIKDCSNVWVDISGSIFRRDDIDYTKKLIGADRILFGSDLPGASFLANLGQIEEAELTAEDREKIYYKNALKLIERI